MSPRRVSQSHIDSTKKKKLNIFDMWVIKPWKSSPKLLVEVSKSRLNASLAALLLFEEEFIQSSALARPHSRAGGSSNPPHLPHILHQRDAAGDAHTCLCPRGLSPCRDQGQSCLFSHSSVVAVLLFITLSLGQANREHQWLGVSHLIRGKELVKAADGLIFAGRLK